MKKKQLFAGMLSLAVAFTSIFAAPTVYAKNDKNNQDNKKPASGKVYYVSTIHGNDNNNGKSEKKAFYSLEKINEITLEPGDQVLLEAGSVFTNDYLHIKGSGSEAAPIQIGKYGKGERPVINTNGEGIWYQDYGKKLDYAGHKEKGYVSSSILLYDVEYIEIRDLEITNRAPKIENSYNQPDVMNRTGVAAIAQNIGTVDHIYLDNLYIHDVIGNVYDKHMNNGGIYFTESMPKNEEATGIAKYNDIRIENCHVENVNRWGIAVGYTYNWDRFQGGVISDETAAAYGASNVAIRNNYVKDAGGDAITTMYCDRPIIEYNVSDGAARQINSTDYAYSVNGGKVAAAVWPWKCKDAVFQYNEVFDTCLNQDSQAWDADWGDGTVYQYNYSHNNGGGCVMFCGVEAIHNIFRYNISQNDLGGVMNPAGQPDAHVYNNTFYVKEGIDFIRTNMGGGPMVVENNIIYYSGAEAKDENWFKHTDAANTKYDNNLYYNYAAVPSNDHNAIVADPLFVDGGKAPTEATASVHDRAAFAGYKLQEGSPAINAGKVIANNGGKDFFGNPVTDIPDLGAYDSGTYGASKDNTIHSTVYMTKENVVYVPSTEGNETTVAEVKGNIEVDEQAAVKVMKDDKEVKEGAVSDGMVIRVTAENKDTRDYTIEIKNAYQWALDYAGPKQGNVWFGQIRNSETEYANIEQYDPDWPNWVVSTYYGVGIDGPDHVTPTTEATHGLLADVVGNGKKAGMAMAYRAPKAGTIILTVKEDEPYLRQNGNANGTVTLKVTLNGKVVNNVDGEESVYTLVNSREKADMKAVELTVKKGDFIRVEASNNDAPSKPSVHVTPLITYQ